MTSKFEVTRDEYRDLDWVVQVNYNTDYARSWESMAAFNGRAVAINYAKDLELSKLRPTHAIIFETPRTVPA